MVEKPSVSLTSFTFFFIGPSSFVTISVSVVVGSGRGVCIGKGRFLVDERAFLAVFVLEVVIFFLAVFFPLLSSFFSFFYLLFLLLFSISIILMKNTIQLLHILSKRLSIYF